MLEKNDVRICSPPVFRTYFRNVHSTSRRCSHDMRLGNCMGCGANEVNDTVHTTRNFRRNALDTVAFINCVQVNSPCFPWFFRCPRKWGLGASKRCLHSSSLTFRILRVPTCTKRFASSGLNQWLTNGSENTSLLCFSWFSIASPFNDRCFVFWVDVERGCCVHRSYTKG